VRGYGRQSEIVLEDMGWMDRIALTVRRRPQMSGHGEKQTRKQQAAIAALLTAPTIPAAAAQIGVNERTLRRWLQLPEFRAAYRQARRELLEGAINRMQSASGAAVDTLLAVATNTEAKAADRLRAAGLLLDHAFRGWSDAGVLHGDREAGAVSPMAPGDVVKVLAARLLQVDQAELSTSEKARLTAALSDAFLRAHAVDVLNDRLETLQAVLLGRKERK
jgi:hypothetical protein